MAQERPFALRRARYALSDEQRALRHAFASFLERECPSEVVRAAEPRGFDEKLWRQVVEMRAAAMGVPEAGGGDGAGLVELALVAEEVGRRLAPVPFIEAAVAARLLATAGPIAEERGREAMANGELLTLALAPLRRGSPQLVPAAAIADGVIGLVDDELVVVTSPVAPAWVDNHGCAPLAWLDVAGTGVTTTTLASGRVATTAFANAREEWKLLMAAALIGATAGVLPLAVEFAVNRIAFGEPIGTFQAMSHPLADAYIGLVGGRRLVWRAAWFADHEPGAAGPLIPMAFVHASRVATQTVTTAVHTQGGLGFTVESDVQLFFRRVKGWANVGGDPRAELQTIADGVYGPRQAV